MKNILLDNRIRNIILRRIPRWQLEGGRRKHAPTVKSWRDTGDTPCRKAHQEEAKLTLPRLQPAQRISTSH
jgi:hypothetical protein